MKIANPNHLKTLIHLFVLNQRVIYNKIRIQSGLNRNDIEILSFASSKDCFNAYAVYKYFSLMNKQQALRTIKKLVKTGYLEVIRLGVKGNPSLYVVSNRGRENIALFYKNCFETLNAV